MDKSMFTRSLVWCAMVGVVMATAACADAQPDGSTDTPAASSGAASPTQTGTAAGFCAAVDGIGTDLTLLAVAEDDPAQFPDVAARAAERFATVQPPEQITESWRSLGDFFTRVDDALQDVEVTGEADLTGLDLGGEEAFAMLLQLPGHIEVVGVHIQDQCQVDLGITPPAIDDVCAAVDPANLNSVFDDRVPEGENRRWGEGMVECFWSADGREVGVVVMRADAMHSELLADATQVDAVADGGSGIDVYDGAFGPLRAASGRTAATTVGQTGVLASVRSADTQAEALKAVALVGLVAGQL